MGVKNVVKKIGGKAADRVAKLSALSPDQVEKIQLQREEYLLQMPKPDDENAKAITQRMLAANSIEIFNSYLPQIKDLYLPVGNSAEYDKEFSDGYNIRYINITKWVIDKKENNLEKLVNVYAVLEDENCNIALVFNRTQHNTNVYLAVVNTNNAQASTDAENYRDRIIEAIRGNFPGAEFKYDDEKDYKFGKGKIPCLDNDREYSVATASNIPTEKSEKFISQTIEKLLDGIVPDSRSKEYTLILLATPITDVEERKNKLGEIHSGLTPYASWSTQFTYTENNSQSSSATVGVNVGASAGVQNGQNTGTTINEAESDSESKTDTLNGSETITDSSSDTTSSSNAHSEGTSETDTKTNGEIDTLGGGVSQSINFGKSSDRISASTTVNANYSHSWNSSTAKALGKTATDTLTEGLSNTVGKSLAKTTGTAVANTVGKAVTKGLATTQGISKVTNFGANVGANFARSSTVTAMIGKGESITQNYANYNIKHALELLEEQMKRFEQSTALGMWDFAAYVLSEDFNMANNVAHTYLALTLGEESYMSKSAINVWRGKVDEERESAKEICKYIRSLRHPLFALNPEAPEEDLAYNVYPALVTATINLSGKELAYSLNFPQKSIAGLPILECAEFGRNVVTYDNIHSDVKIKLGNIFHMNQMENNEVSLNKKLLSSHTFITGSTGSGKSNTIYQILENARNENVKFLVVEPAKGEYKNIFGNDDDVMVYGTNPKLSALLRINPFSFPKDIHVLEHMDRLVEIFNVCWPMYAAMPAVLKNAIEKSYIDCGWNMITSENKYGEMIYPTFKDVARNIKDIIDSSEYDNDNKGAYKGSLLTRLQLLSTGINGLIFATDELLSQELFDENVIVDLSRVGSSETKSLIMGMLVLKLQEYRMSCADGMNVELKHLTVLEEAHNILRRTSVEQSAEGANLTGKSVEMLANAIAEMRTYGEGFVIADQAPGFMDMSVIRNTNTKIIMRLPDQSDRELVGRAANLNEDQITELAKLPCGVAAIYQNEWVQPVLCKIDRCNRFEEKYSYKPSDLLSLDNDTKAIEQSLLDCLMDKELYRKGNRAYITKLKKKVIESRLDTKVKCDLMNYICSEKTETIDNLRTLIFDFLTAEEAIESSNHCNNLNDWIHSVVEKLEPSIRKYSNEQIDLAMALILYEQSVKDSSYNDLFCAFTEVYKDKGGVY